MSEDRKREWIHKPIWHGGPCNHANSYFRNRVKAFREEHKEFDDFLVGLYEFLKVEEDPDYENLKFFIEGNPEANWVSPSGGLFDIFIKLYNLCLSPKQAYEYIKKCHEHYLFMLNAKYVFSDECEPEFSIRRDYWDLENRKFVEVSLLPKEGPEDWDYHYWIDVMTSLKVVDDEINDINTHSRKVSLFCRNEELHDVFMLFVNHQNKPFLRDVFDLAMKELINQGYIKEVKTEERGGWIIRDYDTDHIILDKE